MATLAQRISDLVSVIGADVKSLFSRVIPAGGGLGQVLRKNSSTDFDASWQTLPNATTLASGLMSDADKSKLDGIASGAQVNAVTSVNTRTGAVVVTKSDVGLADVDNTSDASKPVSTATQTALNAKQPTLVSGTNIKTVNGESLLGNGNITVSGGSSGAIDLTVSDPELPPANTTRLFRRSIANRQMPAFVGPSGLDSALQPLIARNKIAWANPNGNSTVLSVMGINLTALGTATAANLAVVNIHRVIRRLEYAVTTAATNAAAGWRSAAAHYHIGATSSIYGGFFMVVRFGRSRGVAANTTLRGFTGLSSLATAQTDSNPSTTETDAIGVGCDAADINYQIIHRNGTSASTKIDTGIPKAVADTSEMYELSLFTAPQVAGVGYEFVRLSDGTKVTGIITENLPADTTLLAPRGCYSVGGTSSVIGYALASLYIETDY